MSCRVARFSMMIGSVFLLAGFGCPWGGPARVEPPSIDASAAGQAAIEQYDIDKDGLIAGAELNKAPALKSAMERLDVNPKDGQVSAEEITARIESWQEDRLGRMGLSCKVTRGGRPLPGAAVTLVPEEFLGDEIQPATGETDETGVADLSVPVDPDNPNDPRGVAPGLYRVEITKQGATKAVYGVEVSQDNLDIQQGLVFEVR